MKIVYIAHPIGGNVEANLKKVQRLIGAINRNFPDILPFAHYVVDCLCLNDDIPEQRERGIKNDREFLRRGFIDELWLCGDHISKGMESEAKLAKSLNIPIVNKTTG